MRLAQTLLRRLRISPACLVAILLIGVPACSSGSDNEVEAIVVRVVDSNTVVVSIDGVEQTVVLDGVETPAVSTSGPNCLVSETVNRVRNTLPTGTTVRLDYGSGQAEPPDASTASVVLADGLTLNVMLVQEGLAIPIVEGADNALAQALDMARSARVGLFSDANPCTVPGQVAALVAVSNCAATVQAQAATLRTTSSSATASTTSASTPTASSTLPPAPPALTIAAGSSSEIAAQVRTAAALVEQATALQSAMNHDSNALIWRALSEAQRASCGDVINTFAAFSVRDHQSLSAALVVAQDNEAEAEQQRVAAAAEAARVADEQRLAAEAEAATTAEEQRLAAEAEAARVAAAQQAAAEAAQVVAAEAAAAAAADEAQRQASAAADAPNSSSSSSGGSSGSDSGSYPGYNGPRCYAPGGKTWKPC